MLVSHLYVFFGEMSVYFFGPFFDWVIYFSGIELHELLVWQFFLKFFVPYVLWYNLHVLPLWLSSKNPPHDAGNMSSTPGLGRSLEKEMATCSNILDWEIPRSEKPGRLQSMGLQKRCDLATKQ